MTAAVVKGRPAHKVELGKAFAQRLELACRNNPNAPPLFHGQQTWLRDRMHAKGHMISLQSVNKWFAGNSFPSMDKIALVAEILSVDPAWLANGATETRRTVGLSQVDQLVDPTARLVGSLIELDGGAIALPETIDPGFSMRAIIRGASYDLLVVPAVERDGGLAFSAPLNDASRIIIVVNRKSGFAFDLYEVTSEDVERFATDSKVRAGLADVVVPTDALGDLRQILDFKSRL